MTVLQRRSPARRSGFLELALARGRTPLWVALAAAGLAITPGATAAQSPECYLATYNRWWSEQCPGYDNLWITVHQDYSCSDGKPAGGPVYSPCNVLGYVAPGDDSALKCQSGVDPKSTCPDGTEVRSGLVLHACRDERCQLGDENCTCPGECSGQTCTTPQAATCDPYRPGAPPRCGAGADDNCDGYIHEGCAPCTGDGCCEDKAGTDPILLSTRSAVTAPFSDFSVDTGLSTLQLTRVYTSADWSYSGGPAGVFGRGWHHEWEGWVTCNVRGTCTVARGLLPGYKFRLGGSATSLDGTEEWRIYVPYWDATAVRGDVELFGPNQSPEYGRPMNQPFDPSFNGRGTTRRRGLSGPGMPGTCGTERCLLNSFASQPIPPYNGLGPNSNTFAAAMLGECGLVGDFPWNAVGSGYSGP